VLKSHNTQYVGFPYLALVLVACRHYRYVCCEGGRQQGVLRCVFFPGVCHQQVSQTYECHAVTHCTVLQAARDREFKSSRLRIACREIKIMPYIHFASRRRGNVSCSQALACVARIKAIPNSSQ